MLFKTLSVIGCLAVSAALLNPTYGGDEVVEIPRPRVSELAKEWAKLSKMKPTEKNLEKRKELIAELESILKNDTKAGEKAKKNMEEELNGEER